MSSRTRQPTGTKMSVIKVAETMPKTKAIAIGDKKRACPLAKKAKGASPPIVVNEVMMTGRMRTAPARLTDSTKS